MPTPPPSPGRSSFTAPVIDYEPPPVGTDTPPATTCAAPTPAELHRHTPRSLRPPRQRPAAPPRAAVVFADAALRRILEVVDRRRPLAHLKPLVAPAVLDSIGALSRARAGSSRGAAAALQRLRLHQALPGSAEVSATYVRGGRVRAIAARVELTADARWQVTALQIG